MLPVCFQFLLLASMCHHQASLSMAVSDACAGLAANQIGSELCMCDLAPAWIIHSNSMTEFGLGPGSQSLSALEYWPCFGKLRAMTPSHICTPQHRDDQQHEDNCCQHHSEAFLGSTIEPYGRFSKFHKQFCSAKESIHCWSRSKRKQPYLTMMLFEQEVSVIDCKLVCIWDDTVQRYAHDSARHSLPTSIASCTAP